MPFLENVLRGKRVPRERMLEVAEHYQHFGGKEGVYAVVVDRAVTGLTELIVTALEAETPRQAAEQAAIEFLGFIEEREEDFRVLVHDAPVVGGSALASVIGDVAGQVEGLLASEFADRGLDQDTAPMYARMLVGAVALVGEWWLEAREPARERVAAHLVNLLWNGLRDLQADPKLEG